MNLTGMIERLVRDRLGCTCPDSVFERMTLDYRGGASPEIDIRIGGRLLIHLRRPATVAAAEHALGEWLIYGRETRDREDLNRFRLVLGLAVDATHADRLQARFTALAGPDPRLHLHLLPPRDLDGLLGP